MKIINFFKKAVIGLIAVIMCLVVYGYYTVPDVITTFESEEIEYSRIYTVSLGKNARYKSEGGENDSNADNSFVKLFNRIPVKTASTVVSKRRYVVPSGEIIGLRMFTKGVLIVTTDSVKTLSGEVNPSGKAGIKSGDIVISAGGHKVTSAAELSRKITESGGNTMEIVYVREGKEYTAFFTPILSSDGAYKAGWWIRDSAAGIGTLTFYEKETGIYGGLGHGICDTDTAQLLPLYYGDITKAQISGCYKGIQGKAGELCASFSSGKIGSIYGNINNGVYGVLDNTEKTEKEIPVALKTEVRTGKATVLCTVNGEGVKEYEIEIEKVDLKDNSSRNLVIKITDKSLLSVTGGIVQGMSGSPIIQNGRLIGAVTHVLINDPTKGYGIFAQTMLETAYDTVKAELKKAS